MCGVPGVTTPKRWTAAARRFGSIRNSPGYTGCAFVGAKGDYDKMIADCTEAIRLDPKFARAYAGRGYAWYFKGDYDKAISDDNEAIRLDPRSATSYYNRGNSRQAKAEYRQALSDYGEAVRVRPKYMAPWGAEPGWKPLAPMRNTVTEESGRRRDKSVAIDRREAGPHSRNPGRRPRRSGRFSECRDVAGTVLELAPEQSKPSVQFRLDLYSSHKPYHQKAATR